MTTSHDASPKTADQFWLKAGEVPTGPFTIPQVHAEMAAGRATWQTPACPVGSGVWRPLINTPGLGPSADPAATSPLSAAASPVSLQTAVAAAIGPVTSAPSPVTSGTAERVGAVIGVGFAVAVTAAVAYGIYECVRPLTATEVCRKIDEAMTAADAKKYATPRMHPLLDYTAANPAASDPNDTFEMTQEVAGPLPDTKLVGFRGSWYFQEAAGRVGVEGHFKVVKADGWKVDDMVFTGVEGTTLPGPVSLVDEHRRQGPAPPTKSAGPPAKSGGTAPAGNKPPASWGSGDVFDPRKNKLLMYGLLVAAASAVGGLYKWAVRPPK